MHLRIPLNWNQLAPVRLLRARLGDEAALMWVLLWTEWSQERSEWRPLARQVEGVTGHPWEDEPLTYLLEEFVRWRGERGHFVQVCIGADVLKVVRRGDLDGLCLTGFWELNEHLSPDFKTIQQKGGEAKAARRERQETEVLAQQQLRLLNGRGLFSQEAVSSAEKQAAIALIMRLDRASGLPVRAVSDYAENLLADAVAVHRRWTAEEINAVERKLLAGRSDPSVIKGADRVLSTFESHLKGVEVYG